MSLLGPRLEYAGVSISVQPAAEFAANVAASASAVNEAFARAAVLGMLDVFMMAEPPLRNVRVEIEALEVDPVNSSAMAFRHAGQDAARKVLLRVDAQGGVIEPRPGRSSS